MENGSFNSSTGPVRLESSTLSRFKEVNLSVLMISDEERIVNSIEGIGRVELHQESLGRRGRIGINM